MREIVFDTETTGIDPLKGDRVVEIGCVEVLNLIPTGNTFHVYINPERDMPDEAYRVHGLSGEFLADKPKFREIADGFLAFIGDDARLVAHNAMFDFGFLNMELDRLGLPILARERIVDTLALARRRNPGGPNSLDALCSRFGIDNSRRTKHGALLDAELLAEVYAELCGGKQATLGLAMSGARRASFTVEAARQRPTPLPPRLSAEELAAHEAFIAAMGEKAIWRAYLPAPAEAAE